MSDDGSDNELAQQTQVGLARLLLDPENPRLPPEVKGSDQRALAVYIASNYDPLRVARSIAAHGYFSSEPLILIAAENGHDYIVVEGNRRLVALRGLSDEALRAEFEESGEWNDLAAATHLPDLYPVVVAPSRRAVAPIIGYRHISGIEPWDPLAKARFVASLIDAADEPIGFAEVASIVGETVGDVRALTVTLGSSSRPVRTLESTLRMLRTSLGSSHVP